MGTHAAIPEKVGRKKKSKLGVGKTLSNKLILLSTFCC